MSEKHGWLSSSPNTKGDIDWALESPMEEVLPLIQHLALPFRPEQILEGKRDQLLAILHYRDQVELAKHSGTLVKLAQSAQDQTDEIVRLTRTLKLLTLLALAVGVIGVAVALYK